MLSVIICAHNPRPHYFQRCLSALEGQTLSREKWELIVIDNASAPDKAPRPDLSWHPGARLVVELQLGLTPARLRGIREAAGDLLVFVDDDNVLDPDFLETAMRVADEKPFLGSWSGQCRPAFEIPPPRVDPALLGKSGHPRIRSRRMVEPAAPSRVHALRCRALRQEGGGGALPSPARVHKAFVPVRSHRQLPGFQWR
jgi:glycosyltransferase involved in cell wall biosynthesis